MCPPTESIARAMSWADREAVPLKTRCSIRWEMPPSASGSAREPVSTQMPTATERTCGIVSVTRRTPLGSALLRWGTRQSPPPSWSRALGRASRRGCDLELLLLRDRGLVAVRRLAREAHLAVAVDLDHLDRHDVALGEHVAHRADAVIRDLGDVEQPLVAGNDLHEGAELLDRLHLAHVDAIDLRLAADVLDDADRHLGRLRARGEHGHLAVVLHVDLGPRLLLDAADDLAAGADDLPDLLRADLDGEEARRVR